jgi:polyhydroxyalkanoate synthesis regulator phasin
MAPSPDLKQYLDAGMNFTAVRRQEARRLAKDLVAQGQLAQERVQSFVDDLVESSRARTDQLLELIRVEVQRQIRSLNLVTRDDLSRVAARITGRAPAKKPAAKKTAAKKTAAKKPAAKKTTKRA